MKPLQKLIDVIYKKLESFNSDGIPLPMLRDPKTKQGSVTLTMWFITFNIAIVTLVGKITSLLGEVDYSSVLWLFVITGSFYVGRKFQRNSDNSITIGDSIKKDGE